MMGVLMFMTKHGVDKLSVVNDALFEKVNEKIPENTQKFHNKIALCDESSQGVYFRNGLDKFPSRYEKCLNNDGNYVEK
ncbi:hypothetical protein TNCV_3258311 [Trichonephila clavipes]|nr:hypothetical protein TNCV_3258311 [Trichonephila clavipes]